MKTIICKFKSEGSDIRKVAILNDSLSELSKSKKNEATDVCDSECFDNGEWSIYFYMSYKLGYEVVFKCDPDTGDKTLVPVRAITWGGDDAAMVIDSQLANVTVKY